METVNWPITTGCENLGGGCESCPSLWEYREKGWDYSVVFHVERLRIPLETKEPTRFLVSFGSDLFHGNVPDWFIEQAFFIMNTVTRHRYELITKRPILMALMADKLNWTPNISVGVTVENRESINRIDHLRKIPTDNRFISFVPLLGSVGKLNLAGIHAAGVGPEEWGLFRPCEDAWIKEVEDQCREQGVEIVDQIYLYEPLEG